MSETQFTDKPVSLHIRIFAGMDGGRLSVIFDNVEDDSEPIQHPWMTTSSLGDALPKVRQLLSTWSDSYTRLLENGPFDRVSLRGELLVDLWHDLARCGRNLYNDLFDLPTRGRPELADRADRMRDELAEGARVIITSRMGDIPWGLLYDAPVPEKGDENFLDEVKKHFWGLKYQIEVAPPSAQRFMLKPRHVLNNEQSTQLTVTINEKMDAEFQTKHKTFFERLPSEYRLSQTAEPPPLRLAYQKESVLQSLLDRQEPQHLYYFYCHHKKGDGKFNFRGYRDFEESKLIVSGRDPSPATAIGFLELRQSEAYGQFQSPPVVFMNSCESAQGEFCNPSGFMFFFTYMLAACPFVGTEAPIPAAFADDLGREFVRRFLRGQPIGPLLLDLRRAYATGSHNPFGLYYTLYGNGNTRLNRAVEEVMR